MFFVINNIYHQNKENELDLDCFNEYESHLTYHFRLTYFISDKRIQKKSSEYFLFLIQTLSHPLGGLSMASSVTKNKSLITLQYTKLDACDGGDKQLPG